MRLTIAYSKIKKRDLVLINNDTHQRETLSERPIRPPLVSISTSLNLSYTNEQEPSVRHTACPFVGDNQNRLRTT